MISHRQRVLNAINHVPQDRMPIDLGVHFSSGISMFAYHNLRRYLGLDTDHIEAIDNVQLLARVDEDVLDLFHIDTQLLRVPWQNTTRWHVRDDYSFIVPKALQPIKNDKGDFLVHLNGGKMRLPEGGCFFDGDWLRVSELDEDELLVKTIDEANKIRASKDRFCTYQNFAAYFLDLEFACLMYTDPDEVIALNDAAHKHNLALLEKMIRQDKLHNIDCVGLNSDLGAQNAPMVNPALYAEFCLPYLKDFCTKVHEWSGMKTFMHSCGSIEPLIPHLIDAGIDILNPVQISAANMEPAMLKQKYGDKICFWGGGCDTQAVLDCKTPLEVRENVKELVSIFKPGAGFVFNQVHNVMGNVPPENIVAMLNAALEFSAYE